MASHAQLVTADGLRPTRAVVRLFSRIFGVPAEIDKHVVSEHARAWGLSNSAAAGGIPAGGPARASRCARQPSKE